MSDKTVFITCGATVPFPQLVEIIFSPTIVEELLKLGFTRIIVQFGKNYRESFVQLIDIDRLSPPIKTYLGFDGDPIHGFCRGFSGRLETIGFEYSTSIQDVIQQNADLVISHAGTGSILDALRLRKPLIICVNDTLMDNHQQQIADQFASLHYLWACLPRVDDVLQCLKLSQIEKTKPFPSAYNRNFERELMHLAYGSSN
ncbi:N-acetylglucosaminyldiphosphodolichol N-acetylglucosaminyltransferase catalytic subunit alg13 [Zygosaccharomyces mellis]|uniref:UDP-N-acetylglucosamine transferase subunit ALG13 n=1 Tax=Zygosaccharomyces mellis TaxID=42258 RepID=A0A4C2EAB1_9SACH|nr:N-acetylglucosaminyldiphosphodolichol N-acetylglucosaminyltransferase catalytic subunit alg13 [Zygosaccharomyces mellis]